MRSVKRYHRYYRSRGKNSYAVYATEKAARSPQFWKAMDTLIDAAMKFVASRNRGGSDETHQAGR